jgi:hypothetical protein
MNEIANNTWFSPMLGYHGMTSQKGEFRTYALNFEKLEQWQAFVTYIRRNGYKIFGRRISDIDDVTLSDDNPFREILPL